MSIEDVAKLTNREDDESDGDESVDYNSYTTLYVQTSRTKCCAEAREFILGFGWYCKWMALEDRLGGCHGNFFYTAS